MVTLLLDSKQDTEKTTVKSRKGQRLKWSLNHCYIFLKIQWSIWHITSSSDGIPRTVGEKHDVVTLWGLLKDFHKQTGEKKSWIYVERTIHQTAQPENLKRGVYEIWNGKTFWKVICRDFFFTKFKQTFLLHYIYGIKMSCLWGQTEDFSTGCACQIASWVYWSTFVKILTVLL